MAFLYNVCTYNSGKYQASVWDVCCPTTQAVEFVTYEWFTPDSDGLEWLCAEAAPDQWREAPFVKAPSNCPF